MTVEISLGDLKIGLVGVPSLTAVGGIIGAAVYGTLKGIGVGMLYGFLLGWASLLGIIPILGAILYFKWAIPAIRAYVFAQLGVAYHPLFFVAEILGGIAAIVTTAIAILLLLWAVLS